MKEQPFPVSAHVGIIVFAVLIVSCAREALVEDPPHQPVAVPVYEQAGSGTGSQWRACTPPGCQTHTPKTLASPDAMPAPSEISASGQDDNERGAITLKPAPPP